MAKIVLISCVSKKLSHRACAKDLYISPLFRFSLRYAQEKLSPNKIFILSAKYGLIQLNDEIDPYNVTLKKMSVRKIKDWASKVLQKLRSYCDLERDPFCHSRREPISQVFDSVPEIIRNAFGRTSHRKAIAVFEADFVE